MHSLDIWVLALTTVTGFFAGTVDSIAGGGGLIALPVLLSLNISPIVALGTNRFQGAIGELVAILRFRKHANLQLKKMMLGIVFTFIGAAIGTITVQSIDPDFIRKIAPFIMTIVFLYVLFSARFHHKSRKPKISAPMFYISMGLLIGFYNGFFGPGTGSFWVVAFMFFLAYPIQQAAIHMKPLNFTGNLVSVIIFLIAGQVNIMLAISMGIGQVFGAMLGSHIVVFKGARYIQPVFLIVVAVMIVNMFVKAYFHLSF